MTDIATNAFLTLGAFLSALAALLHLGCIAFGAPWYRFLGAGESMARLAERGSARPAIITAIIATGLSVWALYAASGAGLIRSLPLLKTALCLITAIYLLRGLGGFIGLAVPAGRSPEFWVWSSLICLAIGSVHLLGLRQVWGRI